MHLWDALKTGRDIRQKGGDAYIPSEYYVFTVGDVLSENWEVEPVAALACPFCNCPMTEVQTHEGTDSMWVTCKDCEAEGPAADTEEEAIDMWNGAKR